MKRISMLVLIVFACFMSLGWAQQRAALPHMGKHAGPKGLTTYLKQNSTLMSSRLFASAVTVQNNAVYDLGHYPEGSWAMLTAINDLGVAAGWGDVASGETHMIGIPIFGPNAGHWFESGFSSDEAWSTEGGGITTIGLVVGSVVGENGLARAYAWTADHRFAYDLGTLPGDDVSAAMATNHLGTIIVGLSLKRLVNDPSGLTRWLTPVAWTPKVSWHNGQPSVIWVIHALPKGGLDQPGAVFENVTVNFWSGFGVNDFGQIVGDGWSDYFDEVAVLWTPMLRGGWKIQRLPHQSSSPAVFDYKDTEALSINNRGEIAGTGYPPDGTAFPALFTKSPKTHAWELTELSTLSGTRQGWNRAWGINDVGDVVGESDGIATSWRTKDPSSAIALGFPGEWSIAFAVNNFGIAVGTYGIGEGPLQAAAVAIH